MATSPVNRAVEALEREVPERFEHLEAGRHRVVRRGRDHRLRHQRPEDVVDVARPERLVRDHALGGPEVEAAGEHREAREDGALGVVEQRVGPVDRGQQRLVSWRGGAGASGEQAESFVDPVEDLAGGHHRDPGGGELECERDAVEMVAELRNRRRVVRGDGEARSRRCGALREDAHGVGVGDLHRVARRVRHRERPERDGDFAVHAQRLATRDEHPHAGTRLERVGRELRGGFGQVFAVVEDQEELTRAQERGDALAQRLTRDGRDAERGRDDLHERGGAVGGGELAEPCPLREALGQIARDVQAEGRLADAAGPGHGDEPAATERFGDGAHFGRAPDHQRQVGRDVARYRERGADGRELHPEPGCDHLEHPLRAADVAQTVLAEVLHLDAVAQLVAHECLGRERDQDLPAVTDAHHPRRLVHRGPVVVAVADLGGASVDAHPRAAAPAHPTTPRRARAAPGARPRRRRPPS